MSSQIYLPNLMSIWPFKASWNKWDHLEPYGTVWTILNHFGPFWTITDQCRSFWTTANYCTKSQTILDHFIAFWTIENHWEYSSYFVFFFNFPLWMFNSSFFNIRFLLSIFIIYYQLSILNFPLFIFHHPFSNIHCPLSNTQHPLFRDIFIFKWAI